MAPLGARRSAQNRRRARRPAARDANAGRDEDRTAGGEPARTGTGHQEAERGGERFGDRPGGEDDGGQDAQRRGNRRDREEDQAGAVGGGCGANHRLAAHRHRTVVVMHEDPVTAQRGARPGERAGAHGHPCGDRG